MEDLAGVFAEVLVAVVDLLVDVSAGFLLLSGCFLSSALGFVLSAESTVKHTMPPLVQPPYFDKEQLNLILPQSNDTKHLLSPFPWG